MSDQLLKAKDVAKKLNICQILAYVLVPKGEISTIRIGKCVRVLSEDVDKCISAQLSNQ